MLQTLIVTGPIYLVIALGWTAVRTGIFSAADMRVLGTFVARFALPALVLSALASHGGEIANPRYLAAYLFGSLAMLLGAFAWSRRARGRGVAESAMRGVGMACSNSGFVGYPIAAQVLGAKPAAAALAMCMVVENLVVIPLGLLIADSAESGHASRRHAVQAAFAQLVRNPLILAIALGFALGLLNWPLPEVIARTVDLVARSSSALSLFVIGGTLVGLKVRGMRTDVLAQASGKLLLHPLAVGLLAWLLLPAADVTLLTAAVIYAASPMLSIYPIVAEKFGLQGFAAAALLLAVTLSFVTISAILGLLGAVTG